MNKYYLSIYVFVFILAQAVNVKSSTLLEQDDLILPRKNLDNSIKKTIQRINEECCEENFNKKSKLLVIKDQLEKCISRECTKFIISLSGNMIRPQAIKARDEANELLDLNNKLSFENEKKNSQFETKQNELLEKSKNDYDKLLIAYKSLEKENIKFKERIEKLLSKYEKRIKNLSEEIDNLKSTNVALYNELPNYKKKKVNKKFKISEN